MVLAFSEQSLAGFEAVHEKLIHRKDAKRTARMSYKQGFSAFIGNLEIKRDWGFAGDYVRAMWLLNWEGRKRRKHDAFV